MHPRLCVALLLSIVLFTGCAPESPPAPTDSTGAVALAARLDADLHKIRLEVEHLAAFTAGLYARKDELAVRAERFKYAFADNGSYYKTVNDGGSALWISGVVPITTAVMAVAWFTEPLDAELIRICREFPEVNQAYYNDCHSLNRIYPWFDAIAQYPSKMNIPEFNFYYLADDAHNPERRGVWVAEPYVDPAGRGWMVSAIAPVHVGGTLVGVPGLDVTVSSLLDRHFKSTPRALVVLAPNGVVVAATESAIELLELPPLKDHKYLETVKQDTFQPDDYNLLKSTVRPVRTLARDLLERRHPFIVARLRNHAVRVISAQIPEIGWTVAELQDDS